MKITILATLLMMLAYFLALYGTVGFIQDKRFFGSAPEENLAAIPDKKERFRGAHLIDWGIEAVAVLRVGRRRAGKNMVLPEILLQRDQLRLVVPVTDNMPDDDFVLVAAVQAAAENLVNKCRTAAACQYAVKVSTGNGSVVGE